MKVGIVTGTPLGAALARRLERDGRAVAALEAGGPLTALAEVRLVVVDATPEALPAVARALGEVLDGNHLLAHTVRGLLKGGTPASVLLRQETACRRIGAIAGPLTAADLEAGRPSAAVVASRHPEVVEELAQVLSTPAVRVYRGHDPLGVEIASALDDLALVGCGLADALGFGETSRAVLIVRAVRELGRIIHALGGEAATAAGLAGLGDLLMRAHDRAQPAYQLGMALAQDGGDDARRALAAMTETVRALLARAHAQAHIFASLVELLDGHLRPAELVARLMALPVLDE
jgi:glycerol-3-phosphate dehydrogenase (NAD(P)+)